jgi:hypothetical protein
MIYLGQANIITQAPSKFDIFDVQCLLRNVGEVSIPPLAVLTPLRKISRLRVVGARLDGAVISPGCATPVLLGALPEYPWNKVGKECGSVV